MRAQHVALGHARLRLAHDELILAQGTAGTCIAALDEHALWQRPRVLASGAVHALWLDGDELHVAAAAAAA